MFLPKTYSVCKIFEYAVSTLCSFFYNNQTKSFIVRDPYMPLDSQTLTFIIYEGHNK